VKYILATGFDQFDKGWRSTEVLFAYNQSLFEV
jgi:hypothetical protein